ncbi:MAG: hypothetical protein JWO81_449 [Alphaproteobacteria bacterium]|nr:hypothetical protein [Alphaproteobacteria bacterium]
MNRIPALLRYLGACALATVAVEPAMAGIVTPTPGPMIGAGAPVLAVFAAGYWLIRRRRRG